MSAYQKFIEASASPPRKFSPGNIRVGDSHHHHKQQPQHYSSSIYSHADKLAMHRQPQPARLVHTNAPPVSSTPISMQHRQHQHQVHFDESMQSSPHSRQYAVVHHRNTNQRHQPPTHQPVRASDSRGATARHQTSSAKINTSATPNQRLNVWFNTDDPLLLKWLRAMRFETELECLTSLQARTLAIDEHSAGALSVRNSQVCIQEMRAESNFILDLVDCLIESLPLTNTNSIGKFSVEFSDLWTRIMNQTSLQTTSANHQAYSTVLAANNQHNNNCTIINCTPRKTPAAAKILRPLDKLVVQIRKLCVDYANMLYMYQDPSCTVYDNDNLEASLRTLKELFGRFVEISIWAECANIVRALNYDFSQSSLNRLSSTSSLLPVRPFESSSSQLPLKWALIALWQLTKDDSFICRVLTEKWTASVGETSAMAHEDGFAKPHPPRAAKRLDYSTKYDQTPPTQQATKAASHCGGGGASSGGSTSSTGNSIHSDCNNDVNSLRSDYVKLYEICRLHHQKQNGDNDNENNRKPSVTSGALSSALKSKHQRQQSVKSVSTIELLMDIIISQPNKHERVDMMNLIHSKAQNDKLVDLDELDQSVSAAIYTSNQYKVAALRILNHLCANEQAVKTILRCFATPPPTNGQPIPENKIIRSIFECYQTAQEHIYQNDTMFHPVHGENSSQRGRKRSRCQQVLMQQQQNQDEVDEYSDYGSRQTNSIPTTNSQADDGDDEGDDAVVKEAIRLLIQLTTVFHRSNRGHDFYTMIGRFSIESLVKYLTNIIKAAGSREMLLLSLTALANISFITTEPMKLYGTNRIMLEMFRASKVRSKDLELRDQAVTILANTADKNLLDIVNNGGLKFLLSGLESCPTKMANYKQGVDKMHNQQIDTLALDIENKPRNRRPIDFSSEQYPDFLDCACDQQQDPHLSANYLVPSLCISRLSHAEMAAMERIHQKTAVAFARIAVDSSTTQMVLNYGGVKQLIDLCKFSHKRNFSDTVLIACIAALRKIAKVIDYDTFKHYNALDLIELELNRALEIYGNPRDLDSGERHRLFTTIV